ncbi:hypothetical protein C8R47DRAFT_1208174 [Mycena vitilis]|nr:hypothetical protein C8R47DRAFT_1208174 [Mycena vitilis]
MFADLQTVLGEKYYDGMAFFVWPLRREDASLLCDHEFCRIDTASPDPPALGHCSLAAARDILDVEIGQCAGAGGPTTLYGRGASFSSPGSGATKRIKRRGPGYIPRPRNSFMIFRSELCASGKIPSRVEDNHQNLSIAAAVVWKSLTDEERSPYIAQAEVEKLEHRRMYPNYRFAPVARPKKDVKRDQRRAGVQDVNRCREIARLLLAGKHGRTLEEAVWHLDEAIAL